MTLVADRAGACAVRQTRSAVLARAIVGPVADVDRTVVTTVRVRVALVTLNSPWIWIPQQHLVLDACLDIVDWIYAKVLDSFVYQFRFSVSFLRRLHPPSANTSTSHSDIEFSGSAFP